MIESDWHQVDASPIMHRYPNWKEHIMTSGSQLVRDTLHRLGQTVYQAVDDVRKGQGDPLATLDHVAQALLFIADDEWTTDTLSTKNLNV